MDKGHWFWNSGFMDTVEKWLLDLTHWVWAKRHNSAEIEEIPAPAKVDPVAVEEKKTTSRKPAAKKAPKGNEWSVK
jgi:hypothetical protein